MKILPFIYDFLLLLSDKMCTFAHGYMGFLQNKYNHKGLNPESGISPNFLNQKTFSGQQYYLIPFIYNKVDYP